ncbi:ABC transporter substrate-binding protein [Egicoccus sp. AB-alg6-2]|uniref:peptide ABC transporter substrate-binding protein n=1 Tax=Egicoccus sp. AB-alg6-2 TaxID=3242692 RepID=UPI00359CFC09
MGTLLFGACTGGAVGDPEPPATAPTLPSAGATGDASGGTLRIGLALDPVSIDPRFVADDEGELVVGSLFEPLVTFDERLQVVPAAATHWEMLDEGARWIFHLREAQFHDGTPVTARDFVRTFTRLLDGAARPPSYLGFLLESVEGAASAQQRGGTVSGLRAIDERTLQIELVGPEPGFLRTLADPSLVPVPASADEDLEAFALQPIGNGPFAMREPREPGQFLRLARFPNHHRAPLLDEVVLSVYAESAPQDQQWDDLLAGQLHVAQIPPERIEPARDRFGTSPDGYRGPGLLDGITATVYLYGFDTSRPPFDDVRVRRALSLSIDRPRLAGQVLAGSRVAAYGIVPPSVPGAQARACAYCRHDPVQARSLWQEVAAEYAAAEAEGAEDGEAGGVTGEPGEGAEPGEVTAPDDAAGSDVAEDPDDGDEPTDAAGDGDDPEAAEGAEGGEGGAEADDGDEEGVEPAPLPDELARITLTHNRGRTHSAVAERMADDIEAALGITVDLEALDLGPFVQRVRERGAGVFRIGWESGDPSPGAYLRPLFHSGEIGRENLTGYADERVDALLDEARSLEQPAAARTRYREAERLILQDQPVLPLLWYRQPRVVAPEVEGLRWAPFGRIDLTEVRVVGS